MIESFDEPVMLSRRDLDRIRQAVLRVERGQYAEDEPPPSNHVEAVPWSRMHRINPTSSEPGQVWTHQAPNFNDATLGFTQLGQEWLSIANDAGVGWLGRTPYVDSPMFAVPGFQKHLPLWQIPRMRFRNSTQENILPHHLVRIYGPALPEGWREGGATSPRRAMQGGTPNTYGTAGSVWVNGETVVKPGDHGTCYYPLSYPIAAAYDEDADPPGMGERWGPMSGETVLQRYAGGFMTLGLIDADDEHLVAVVARPQTFVMAKTSGTWTKGTTQSVNVWHGPFTAMENASATLSAYNFFHDVDSGKWVALGHFGEGDTYLAIAGEIC